MRYICGALCVAVWSSDLPSSLICNNGLQSSARRNSSLYGWARQSGGTPDCIWHRRSLRILRTRQFLILDVAKRVLLVTSPLEIRRAPTKSQPKLEMAYLRCGERAKPPFATSEVDSFISSYPDAVSNVFAGPQENSIKEVVTPTSLRELGIKQQGEVLERSGKRPFSYAEILRLRERYVVLVRDGEVGGSRRCN
jgi:hypothetical protein